MGDNGQNNVTVSGRRCQKVAPYVGSKQSGGPFALVRSGMGGPAFASHVERRVGEGIDARSAQLGEHRSHVLGSALLATVPVACAYASVHTGTSFVAH